MTGCSALIRSDAKASMKDNNMHNNAAIENGTIEMEVNTPVRTCRVISLGGGGGGKSPPFRPLASARRLSSFFVPLSHGRFELTIDRPIDRSDHQIFASQIKQSQNQQVKSNQNETKKMKLSQVAKSE